uniref:Uncharacterized protein n=1 Tax=Chromera velia CCMP2878 TaxID=1169474 RepID=A0A0G4GVE0_9ALVE|eukprot:Cvel_5266.t1-p1 / transcript=Cvel_5266.t1 / gene=Cvel_5266 / organism=Chromera_velia_CCMP2878 / gene_product=hypothetical protein / transcript_product=hypothetical protein / location=Cvel_scaffold243:35469-41705(-) / protein_length=247 / sequence_SO=supercontig / SO=protein_coding / is_pseudo=false
MFICQRTLYKINAPVAVRHPSAASRFQLHKLGKVANKNKYQTFKRNSIPFIPRTPQAADRVEDPTYEKEALEWDEAYDCETSSSFSNDPAAAGFSLANQRRKSSRRPQGSMGSPLGGGMKDGEKEKELLAMSPRRRGSVLIAVKDPATDPPNAPSPSPSCMAGDLAEIAFASAVGREEPVVRAEGGLWAPPALHGGFLVRGLWARQRQAILDRTCGPADMRVHASKEAGGSPQGSQRVPPSEPPGEN